MQKNDEQREAPEGRVESKSFLSSLLEVGFGLPLFCLSVSCGYFLGSDDWHIGDLFEAMTYAWVDFFNGLAALVAVPIIGTCFLLMLYSELPKVSIAAVSFLASAWSAWSHESDFLRGIAIAIVSIVVYMFCIYPVVLDYRRNRDRADA